MLPYLKNYDFDIFIFYNPEIFPCVWKQLKYKPIKTIIPEYLRPSYRLILILSVLRNLNCQPLNPRELTMKNDFPSLGDALELRICIGAFLSDRSQLMATIPVSPQTNFFFF